MAARNRARTLWILNHYALPPDLPGGTRHFELARELGQYGYDVVIFASAFNHKRREQVRLADGERWGVEKVDGVKFVWVPSFAYRTNDWRRMANMLDYTWRTYLLGRRLPGLEAGVSPPDIVMGCSVHLFAVLAGHFLSRHYHARFLMEVRDLWPQTFLDMGLWRQGQLQVRFFHWLEKYLYARAERIVTLSPLTRDYLARYSTAWADKVAYIPNGTRISWFRQDCQGQRQASGRGYPALTVRAMYLGAIGVTNGLELVLRAMRVVNETAPGLLEFVFVGDGPEKGRLSHLAKEWQLENVRFEEPVPRAQVPCRAAQADVLVLVQRQVLYGSSNKLYDYMAAAKPIVFAVLAEHNRPLEQAQCGVYALPEDPEDLAAKLITVARLTPEERAAMGRRGRFFVEQHHDYPLLAKKLAAVLDELGTKDGREASPHPAIGS